jgi:hypothetical protein
MMQVAAIAATISLRIEDVHEANGEHTQDNRERGHCILPQSNFERFFRWTGANILVASILDICLSSKAFEKHTNTLIGNPGDIGTVARPSAIARKLGSLCCRKTVRFGNYRVRWCS